jgi:hypothetical protein
VVINGGAVQPIDPLYLRKESMRTGGKLYGKPIEYPIEAPSSNGHASTGNVIVTFSELPVHAWHELSNDEKRRLGISNGAGVSVVRAEREIDFGWFFMGTKRRENYDDWWRCEIRFDPVLDEAFGITHTKQQIRPQDYLLEILSPDIENLAKALNSRIRQAHLQVRSVDRTAEVERIASERDELLKPLPKDIGKDQEKVIEQVAKRHPSIKEFLSPKEENGDKKQLDLGLQYRIIQDQMPDTSFFSFAVKEGLFVLILNPDHPFYKKVYKPLVENDNKENKEVRSKFDLLLLACARAEAAAQREGRRSKDVASKEMLLQLRKTWSDNLATFLNG